ncbi:uncharacterized protein E0L32_004389 [Thyridium curvatum]|uniref:RRM domain-containing protein n=1 Tax=Thyridium curvatum TaxID=1093900 RepID=A0A507BDI3_9PEZI|nr:uncharacterized protein E0L32_004389 [Thyridium curvatum]TPX15409.1 hypothetical protein E0L32_004389 [Thyridium curvatum]
MDRSLDEILAERKGGQSGGGSRGSRGGQRRRDRQDNYPRDGIRKVRYLLRELTRRGQDINSYRDEAPRNLDSESRGAKIRVENVHYELTEEDLSGLFEKIGPIAKLELVYDRAGRSEGVAYVTYQTYEDAKQAVREYDGANAAGQPIRMTIVPLGSGGRRNPFDTAVKPGRPLAERITAPGGRRSRSLSPGRDLEDDAARRGIDRYVPGRRSRSRSPQPRGRRTGGGGGGGGGGRRPGDRRGGDRRGGPRGEGGERERNGGGRGRDGRPKKTQEELDAEMNDYFNAPARAAAQGQAEGENQNGKAHDDDVDMIE